MNKCRKIIIGLKKLKIQVIKREKKKEEEKRIKKKKKKRKKPQNCKSPHGGRGS